LIKKEKKNLIGFFLLKTASGRTKRRSLPLGTFQEVMQPPNRYISASLQLIENSTVNST
jgi:hypothetical protein